MEVASIGRRKEDEMLFTSYDCVNVFIRIYDCKKCMRYDNKLTTVDACYAFVISNP